MNVLAAITAAPDPAIAWFRDVIEAERDALSAFLDGPLPGISEAIALLAQQERQIILIGVGKSGHVAAKLAATFSSLGTPALFVNAGEAAHGDLGAVPPGSAVLLLSNSGATEEIVRILPLLKARGCMLIGIIGRADSPLARAVDHLILAEVECEADHIGMAPTSSTTLHLTIGDALAVAVSRSRGFTRADFLRHHPAGLLGRQMIPVASIMRQGDDLPRVEPATPLVEVLTVMSRKRLGAACVVDGNDRLIGLIVDGDVRRHLQSHGAQEATAGVMMRRDPQVAAADATIGDILLMRNTKGGAWLVLPVVDSAGRLLGMIHTNDLFQG
ncbi:KpsF/GutQ family sugar-phosphate isomerase [Stakelama sp. CBK3Z-3]|uniref:KpsF/GutQ family sugar-phosphate isomerase n=1 Tax=Stakelama flava TaxID=2860338 RepID=A0ABS6XIP6_9SPHN|nr:KpsF/GutQ family sugar-phosphate isomerase [Stakelama flava]MBW4330084.1 KpsF/GutQ family sugar-phosphate isomerase [Stakelama flava]